MAIDIGCILFVGVSLGITLIPAIIAIKDLFKGDK
jgi:hypothetical protein